MMAESKNGEEISNMVEEAAVKELENMKRRLKELEEEADALREKQAKIEREIEFVQDPREEVDSRSIFVGNVDYACTPEEVQHHFQSCGTVNRVTILTDKFGHPKGFAYVEFDDLEAVQEALQLNESELHGRQLKVQPKRTNVPGLKQNCPWEFNPYMTPYPTPHVYPPNPYEYGKVPRFRGSTRYMPYN